MRAIDYTRNEFLMPWKWRKRSPLWRFILEIPYAVYIPFAPSREALNEMLRRGSAGGGMGTGVIWEPFELNRVEYDELCTMWKETDLSDILKSHAAPGRQRKLIFDHEVLAIPHHTTYLLKAREKLERDSTGSNQASAVYFRRRRNFHLAIGCFFAAALVLMASAATSRISGGVLLIGGLAGFTGFAVYSLAQWSCPACHEPFGRGHTHGRCEHCGARFKR